MNRDTFGQLVYRILTAADIVKSDRVALSCRHPGGTASISHIPLAADTMKTPSVKPYWGKPAYGISGRAMQTLASCLARNGPLLYATDQRKAPDLLLTRQVLSASSHRCGLLARFIRFCDGKDLLVPN
jgi:hypothetical protein